MSPIRAAAPCSVRWRGRGTGPARRRYLLSPCVVAGLKPTHTRLSRCNRSPRRAAAPPPTGQVDDAGNEAGRVGGARREERCFVDTQTPHAVHPVRILDQRPTVLEDCLHDRLPAGPYWPATRATVLPSCPTRRQASRRAPLGQRRPRPDVLTGLRPVRRGQSGSMQRHARLIHTRITGRPPAGRSRTSVRRRSSNRALVSMAYSISLSCSDTVSSTNPERRASPSPQSVVVHLGPPSTRVQAPRI